MKLSELSILEALNKRVWNDKKTQVGRVTRVFLEGHYYDGFTPRDDHVLIEWENGNTSLQVLKSLDNLDVIE